MARNPIDPRDLAPLREALREWRLREGLTLEEAAEVLGLSDGSAVLHYETKVRAMPVASVWLGITEPLEVSRVELLGRLGYLDKHFPLRISIEDH